jgi:hypothetical protein
MPRVCRFQALAGAILATAVTAAGLFSASLALAQQLPHLAGTPDSDSQTQENQPEERDQSVSTLKVNVNVVQLFFNVKDKKGALIPSLTKDDFQLLEDGKAETIKYFTAESDLPLTLGILIDSSGSQQRVLEMEKEVGGNFLGEILRPKDLAFVISFDVDSNLLQDFTNSSRRLREALNSARINAPPSSCGGLPGAGGGPLPCSLSGRSRSVGERGGTQGHDPAHRRGRPGQSAQDQRCD